MPNPELSIFSKDRLIGVSADMVISSNLLGPSAVFVMAFFLKQEMSVSFSS
jgi:hypothetical protein